MNDRVNPIPEGFHTVRPFLCVRDPAGALEFYQKAFGAVELVKLVEPSGRIGHVEIKIGDSPVMIQGENPGFGVLSPETIGGTPVRMHLYVEDAEALVEQAVAAGATLKRPVGNQFYGNREGAVTDPFGHIWLIATRVEDVSPDEMQRRLSPPRPANKAELLEKIHRSRSALEALLSPLSDAQLTTPGLSGWSIKDHLAHLATWELGIAELLQRRPRFAAMQVEDAVSQGKSEDEINDLIYRRHANLPLSEVMSEFEDAHRQMLLALDALDDEDLLRPYSSYLREGNQSRQDPVVYWVIGNTYEHFDEHYDYIRKLIQG